MTASDSVPTAVECLRLGASDYVTKPFEVERIRAIARECAERLALRRALGSVRRTVLYRLRQ